jgi:2-alkenal reductase
MSRKNIIYAIILVVVAAGAALGGAFVGGSMVYSSLKEQETLAITPTPTTVEAAPVTDPDFSTQILATDIDTAITQAVERVGPAVVTVVGTIPGRDTFFGRTPNQPVSGSGVIISQDGYIITNNHVIEGTIEISIILADGTAVPAQLVGADVFSDLAVLQIDTATIPAVARLGNSDRLKPGETVIAIGSPPGRF